MKEKSYRRSGWVFRRGLSWLIGSGRVGRRERIDQDASRFRLVRFFFFLRCSLISSLIRTLTFVASVSTICFDAFLSLLCKLFSSSSPHLSPSFDSMIPARLLPGPDNLRFVLRLRTRFFPISSSRFCCLESESEITSHSSRTALTFSSSSPRSSPPQVPIGIQSLFGLILCSGTLFFFP